jgi:hypothetical protein
MMAPKLSFFLYGFLEQSSLFETGFLILFDLGGSSDIIIPSSEKLESTCLSCQLVEGQSTIKILNFTNCSSTIFLKIEFFLFLDV